MAITILPKEKQGYGAFNGGEIVENKPIGFPSDHSTLRPYSNLFYWAHARAVVDSTIGLHPHQGFEICSFVLKGKIRHFDTKLNEWRPLESGDVQIIRAGNGISHSEAMNKDAEIFQIWFDPDLTKTMSQPASYDDYRAVDFPVESMEGKKITRLAGVGSPFKMDTPGIEIERIDLNNAHHSIPASPTKTYSIYVLEGEAILNGTPAQTSDFALVTDEQVLEIQADTSASLFLISSPKHPGYRTYAELMKARIGQH